LHLPEWIATSVILLLIIGFPITAILSWIFDITPEGIQKTKSVIESRQEKTTSNSAKRRLKVSDLIIAVLIVVVIILSYPKIFRNYKIDNLKNEEGKISITVMPFQNLTPDTLFNVWQEGVQNLLISSLSNSEELSVRQPQTMFDILKNTDHTSYASITPSVGSKLASTLETNTFILGKIMKAGNNIRISAQLRSSESEDIYRTFKVDGNSEDDFFIIVDSLSNLIKDYLEIKKIEQELDDEKSGFATTSSAEAYRHFIKGLKFGYSFNLQLAIQSLNKAVEIDSTFTNAYSFLSLCYWILGQNEEATEHIKKAYVTRDKIPINEQLFLDVVNGLIEKNYQEVIIFEEQLVELMPQSAWWWRALGNEYQSLQQYKKSVEAYERAYELYKQMGMSFPMEYIYSAFAYSLHKIGNHEREKEICEEGLNVYPNRFDIIYQLAICALSQGDSVEAQGYISKYKSIREDDGSNEFWTDYNVGNIYLGAEHFEEAMKIFRELTVQYPEDPWSKLKIGSILIINEINIDQGLEFIDDALESEPDDGDLLHIKGLGLYKQEKVAEAYELLKLGWDIRNNYNHDHYLLLQEVEQALAKEKNE